jgi:hypothetical protein
MIFLMENSEAWLVGRRKRGLRWDRERMKMGSDNK